MPDARAVQRHDGGGAREHGGVERAAVGIPGVFGGMLRGTALDADDATQDVFLRAFEALRRDARPVEVRPWLFRVAHNRCLDLRRRAPAAELPGELAAPAAAILGWLLIEKLKDGKRCNGAPDWVVEIVSPSNAEKELRKKMEIYQEAQVSEYWVIRPEEKELDIYLLREGRYVPQLPLFAGDIVAPEKFPQLQIDLTTIF